MIMQFLYLTVSELGFYYTVIIRILRMIQFNVRNSILVIYHESNPM